MPDNKSSAMSVKEKSRKLISNDGAVVSLHNVTSFDSGSGDYLRIQCDEGYVIVNNDNLFAMIIDGERVR